MKDFFTPLLSFVTSRKFYVALIGFLLILIPLYIQPVPEWYEPLIAFLTAIGVYAVPNSK